MLELWTASPGRRLRAVLIFAIALLCLGPAVVLAADAVAHYQVDARFDSKGQLTATVEMELPAAEAGPETVLLLNRRFKIASVDAGAGAKVDVTSTDLPVPGLQSIAIRYGKPAQDVRVRVRYAGPINPAGEDPTFSSQRVELNLEQFWLPIRRDLNMFFSIDARVRGLPRGITAIAQGELRQRGTELTVKRTMPDTDLTIAGAPSLQKRSGADVEFYASDLEDPLVALMYEHAIGAAAFHREIYGPPQDGPIRMVIVPRASSGGYARRNFIVMPTFRKPGDPVPAFDKPSPARFVAHEFNHAWMKIPEQGGDNYWVGESVAEYMGLRYIERAFGADEVKTQLERKRKSMSAGPLLSSRRPTSAALYQKGPVLLFDLEQRIGRQKLDNIVARADRPRSAPEFFTALTAVAGEAQAKEFERRLNEGGTAYTVIMSGANKGELTVADDGDGQRRAVLRFDDRGRGPDMLYMSKVDNRGWLTSYSAEGLSYSKRPVVEHFDTLEGRAKWSSPSDSGEAAATGFYVPTQASAEDVAALARALLAADQGTLPVLPVGQARIEKVVQHELRLDAETVVKPTMYLIHGLDMQPGTLWLDEKRELFASGDSWLVMIKKGFEAKAAELIGVQEQALADVAATRIATLRREPTVPVVIRNTRLFDAQQRVARPGMSVVMRGDRIERVGPDSTVKVPSGAEVIDAAGKTLLPGMWDMHVHVHNDGVLALLAGLTGVRDLGNDADTLERITRDFDSAKLAGPWIVKAALIDGRGQFEGPTKFLVSTPEEMRSIVGELADRGYPQIKLYSSVPRELVGVAIEAARKRGMRISGHVPAGMTMREAVLAGYDEVQHANFWFLNFMDADTVAKTNTPVRFMAVARQGRDLDLSSPQVRDFISLLKQRGTVVDPTLVVFENMFTGWKGELAKWMEPWADRLPASSMRGARSGGRALTPEERVAYTESFTRMKQMLKALYYAGVPIVPGTDGSALLYSRELELYVEAGIPAADVLHMATLGAARVANQDRVTGSIAAGKRADLVLIDGDPLQNISDVRRTSLVIKGGVIYDAHALAVAAGLKRDHE